MEKSQDNNSIHVLVLEDDEAFLATLTEVLVQEGFVVHGFLYPNEALDFLQKNKVQFIVCDCLLPQMTGLSFVEKVQNELAQSKAKVIMMSGIYTDKNYIQDSIKSTKAIAFFKKPFDTQSLLDLLKKTQEKKDEHSSRKRLYQTFANPNLTDRQKRKLLEALDEISGFDLPIIYSLLVETKTSGYLNIYDHKGVAVSSISISDGQIVSVDSDDKSTFLGEMLIQSGYVNPDDVKEALKDKKNRRLGSYLIESNLLSPHAFDMVLAEQMNIRLSRMIIDEKVKVNFSFTEVNSLNPAIDSDMLLFFLHDWIASKISIKWLKSFYTLWSGHRIQKTVLFRPDHESLKMSLIQTLPGFIDKIEKNMNINQILEDKTYSELAVLKAIHFLLIKGLIVFSPKAAFANEKDQYQTLLKIQKEIEGKNPVEVLDYMESCTFSESSNLNDLQEEFMKLLGDCPVDKNSEVHRLWARIDKIVQDCMHSSTDQSLRQKHKQTQQKHEAEAKLKANTLMDEAKKSLQLGQYKKAQEFLMQIQMLKIEPFQFHIVSAWIRMGLFNPQGKKDQQLKEIELEILQIPPDEKYDPLFPLINGMLAKLKGDFTQARKQFEKCLALDPTFIVARREISLLDIEMKKKQDVLKMDLKDLVSGFFKKK